MDSKHEGGNTYSRHCEEHSGCMARIKSLEARGRIWDTIYTDLQNKMNIILGGVVVSCVALIANLIVLLSEGK